MQEPAEPIIRIPKRTELIKFLAERPDHLYKIPPRDFEQLVAELLAGFGWQVNLTAAIRDGGYDILGLCQDAPGLSSSWVVECKRYHPRRRVGVEHVRQLSAVKNDLRMSNGLLVTTSTFTAGARQLTGTRRDIQLVDYEALLEWLHEYRPSKKPVGYLVERSFQSCFVSYSHKDQEFAEFLCRQLRESGVGVWFAPEDVLPGEKLHDQIKRAIKTFDRLLIVLSEASLDSEWVKTELRTARRRELDEDRRVLFPIRLVDFERLRQWECFDADTGKDLAVEVREYPIPDFSNWTNTSAFSGEFRKLLTGLVAPEENA
jgi:hypothetical protein